MPYNRWTSDWGWKMADLTKEEIRRFVLNVLKEMEPAVKKEKKPVSTESTGSYIFCIFHAGVRKLEAALKQVQLIEEYAGKCGIYTGESARAWVCGSDVREKAGTRCILDNVKTDGLNKVLERADLLVLPTFCLRVAAKVAHMICDDPESSIVLSALLQGKRILATRDSFMICDILVNERLQEEIDAILEKLQSFGLVFCETEQLNEMLRHMMDEEKNTGDVGGEALLTEAAVSATKFINAKDIHAAVDQKNHTLLLSPGGIVTPLAKDLAKEYSIKIVKT